MSSLGVSTDKHRYDLPLNKDAVAGFQVQMTALMVTLACWALLGFLSMNGLSNYWVDGLKNNITIELSPITEGGGIIETSELESRAQIILEKTKNLDGVSNMTILSREEITALIGAWVDKNDTNLPLPVLIAVEIDSSVDTVEDDLTKATQAIHKNSVVNTHKDWLSDFLKTAYFLRYGALFIFFTMITALFLSVRGIVKARMATYSRDIELLHLIGAADLYIAKQFQRHAMMLSFKGVQYALGITLIGVVIAYMILKSSDVLPQSGSVSFTHIIIVLFVPIISIGLSAITARQTVLKTLNRLP